MKRLFPTLILIFLFTLTIFSQTPKPTPTPIVDEDIVKITTALIQVDVTVTDSSGIPIKDLKPEDFEIYENGEKQNITNFSFISGNRDLPKITDKPKSETNELSAPNIPNKLKPEQIRRTIALVVDDLTLSFESMHFVRRSLRKFVNEQMQEGDLVAIIRTGGGIGALQQFTSDKRQLLAAIKKIRWNPRGTGGVSAFAPIEPTPLEIARANGDDTVSDEDIEEERNQLQNFNQFRTNVLATGTLGAMNYVIRGMKPLPGRKSIMLMSDGFSLVSTTRSGFTENSNRIREVLKELIDLANRSSVVIYSIDARGLQTLGFSAADSTALLSQQAVQQRLSERRTQLFNSQEGLVYLSKETGGFAILNNNDISGGIKKVLNDQSYYLLGYEPDSETFDPEKRKFNKLEIKVKRKNVKVRYRSGFFGVTDESPAAEATLTGNQKILTALTSPFAVNDINLSLNTVFKGDAKDNLSLSSFVNIKAEDLKFIDKTDGKKQVMFDVLAMSFGDNGVPIGKISKTYTISVKGEQYENTLKNGFVYFFTFPVEKAGAYQMRIAIRDHATDKVGSASQFIEVPKLSKNRLTLSGLVLENLTYPQWRKNQETGQKVSESDPFLDTSLRKFKRGSVLTYGFEIYNAKSKNKQTPQLEFQTRLFYNGKVIFKGKKLPIKVNTQKGLGAINYSGALNLGTEMQLGDYVLQIIVTDKLAKRKHQIATQFVEFEVIE